MIGAKTLSKSQICLSKPTNLSGHINLYGEEWGEWARGTPIGEFDCQRGTSSYRNFKSTSNVEIDDKDMSLWCKTSTGSDPAPFKVNQDLGKEYYMNAEVKFKASRNWPKFTGFGFESYNANNGGSNTLYLRRVATCWMNKDGDEIFVASPFDGSSGKSEANQYNYWGYQWLDGYSDELITQDEGYVFTGFRFNYRSKSGTGSSTWKHVLIYNLKMYTDFPDMPDGTRVVLPKMMEFDESGGYPSPIPYGDNQ